MRRRAVIAGIVLFTTHVSDASWVPRPFTHYRSEPIGQNGNPEGTRRFRHEERHSLVDGSDLELTWEVEANPDELLALDLEHQQNDGVRLLECAREHLVIDVPSTRLGHVRRWRHVTASHAIHGCPHLSDNDLYHRVLSHREENSPTNQPVQPTGKRLKLSTKELGSISNVFPNCQFSFRYIPIEAKHPPAVLAAKRAAGEEPPAADGRRLFSLQSLKDMIPDQVEDQMQRSRPQMGVTVEKDPTTESNSMLHVGNIPAELSHMSWNYDYEANTTKNPQFKYNFPGGKSWLRLYKPYMKAHFGLDLNFTSKWKSMWSPPHVVVHGELKGYADFNADVAAAINFNSVRSATIMHDILDKIEIPGIGNLGSKESNKLSALKFYIGPTPMTIRPRWACQLKAYHVGTLQGSLRFGLATTLQLSGLMYFSTDVGLQTNFSAQALNVSFTPPTWMLFTEHFELGVMLQPEISFKGGFAEMQDMEYGMELRPYFNVSIMQEGAEALEVTDVQVREVAVYPFRVVGLPEGKKYKVGVRTNNVAKWTCSQLSSGVIEFNDNVQNFLFGEMSQGRILGKPIQVVIVEEGHEQPVGIGHMMCSNTVNGMCEPSPSEVKMRVNGREVVVQLTVVWADNALNILESKMKSVSLRFPLVSVTAPQLLKELAEARSIAATELQWKHNGRFFAVQVTPKDNDDSPDLSSDLIFELGPQYLDNWKTPAITTDQQATLQKIETKVELLVKGKVVGIGSLPPISWDSAAEVPISGKLGSTIEQIPVSMSLYNPDDASEVVGSAQFYIDIVPISRAAFWVTPYMASEITPEQSYALRWTTHVTSPGNPVEFKISALQVDPNGKLVATTWDADVVDTCQMSGSTSLHRYNAGAEQCVFSSEISVPATLVGQYIVLAVSWQGDLGRSHRMVSVPVTVGSSAVMRKLQGLSPWGSTHLGYAAGKGAQSAKVKSKLAKLKAKACDSKPLKYGIGAGMNFIQRFHNIVMPFGMEKSPGAISDAPDWKSQPIKVFKLGTGDEGEEVKKLLPKSVCAGGICNGILPGCQKKRVNPIGIKQVVFRISRRFKWKEHIGPKIRHAMAYGLAVLPDAVDVTEKEVEAELSTSADAPESDVSQHQSGGAKAETDSQPQGGQLHSPPQPPPDLQEPVSKSPESTLQRPMPPSVTPAPAPSPSSLSGTEGAKSSTTDSTSEQVSPENAESPTTSAASQSIQRPSAADVSDVPAVQSLTESTTTFYIRTPLPPVALGESVAAAASGIPLALATSDLPTVASTQSPTSPPTKPKVVETTKKSTTPTASPTTFPTTSTVTTTTVITTTVRPTTAGTTWEQQNVPFEMVAPFNPSFTSQTSVNARRLAGPQDDWDVSDENEDNPEADGVEFNKFKVRIVKPMDYELTPELLQTFMDRQAFRITDGREEELGPIHFTSFEMLPLNVPHDEGIDEATFDDVQEEGDVEEDTEDDILDGTEVETSGIVGLSSGQSGFAKLSHSASLVQPTSVQISVTTFAASVVALLGAFTLVYMRHNTRATSPVGTRCSWAQRVFGATRRGQEPEQQAKLLVSGGDYHPVSATECLVSSDIAGSP